MTDNQKEILHKLETEYYTDNDKEFLILMLEEIIKSIKIIDLTK
tara:strand:+ start:859 stop:990 length:132 start_codon:yes stop_codon:yes gene_type:complete